MIEKLLALVSTHPYSPFSYDYYGTDDIFADEKWLSNVLSMCDRDYENAMMDASVIQHICEQVAENI